MNPFATGVASDAAGSSIGDGIGYRFLMYLVLVPIGVLFVLRYAKKVKADPSKSRTTVQEGEDRVAADGIGEVPELTGKQKSVLAIIGLTSVTSSASASSSCSPVASR